MANTQENLDSVCEFIVDCLHATAPTVDKGYPLVRTPNIGRGRLNLDNAYKVSKDTYKKWTRRAVPRTGDLILAREAPAGNVAVVKCGQRVCLGQRTVLLRPIASRVDPDFLCYFLLAPPQQGVMLSTETGATSKHVNMADIRRLPLEGLPPVAVQRRTGAVIAAYDDLIENNHRRIRLLEQSARLLYEEWFVRLRFPGHESATVINGMPEGWEKRRLDELADVTIGQSPPSSQYNEIGEGLPFHQGVGDFGDQFVTHRVFTTATNRISESGDILCSVRAPVGRLNVTTDRVVIGRGLAAMRSRFDRQSFLLRQLRAHFFKENMIGTGAIFASVGKKELLAQRMLTPDDSLISLFEEQARPIDMQLRVGRALFIENRRLGAARDLLLPRLMNGDIAV